MTSFKPDEVRKYFEARLQGQRLAQREQVAVRCPFHDDHNASMSVNLERGVWSCHAGCGDGGIIAFETKFSHCDERTAAANVSELLGRQLSAFSQKPEAVYQYHDAAGLLVFEKLRYPGRRFQCRHQGEDGRWVYNLDGVKQKPLYRLPEVLVASELLICEGEKDVDNVRALDLGNRDQKLYVASTCNFDGAGKWRDEYSPYFLGKKAVILADNDEPGRKHADHVARSLHGHALGVKVIHFPELPEKGDVSDYLQAHSKEELIALIKRTAPWRPEAAEDRVLAPAIDFINATPPKIDWTVEGVIERGANGFFVAQPKGGKSWVAADLALSLALGVPWMEFTVPEPLRVALVSREDNPSTTGWRLRHLAAGKGGQQLLLQQNLYVNSRAQTPEFLLDNAEQRQELVDSLQRRVIQFAIFDVFNVMHAADENDNSEMRQILRQLSAIQSAVGCAIGVVHHFNKAEVGSLTQRMRGASAIAGWAEWLVGISMAEEEQKIRKMEFELKAAAPPDAIHFQIHGGADGAMRLERANYTSPARSTGRAAALMQ